MRTSLLARVRPYRLGLAAGALFLLATNALALAVPWLLQRAIDGFSARGAGGAAALALETSLLLGAIGVGAAVVRIASRILIFNAGRNVEYDLRRDLFDHLLTLPPSWFARNPTGDVMSRLTNDLTAVRVLIGFGALNVVNTAFVYMLTLARMVQMNPELTLYAMLPFPVLIVFGQLSGRAMFKRSREVADELGRLSSRVQEDLAAMGLVKSYALEGAREATFRVKNEEYAQRSMRLVVTRGLMGPLLGLLAAIGTLIVLWGGGRAVVRGELTLGELAAFQLYLLHLAWPTIALGFILSVFQRGLASWARLREVFEAPPEPDVPETAAARAFSASAAGVALELRGLTVRRGDALVLDGVSLSVPAGGTVAVVGRTGSGKSTLADALVRMVEVPRGALLLDGTDINDLPLRTLRAAVGYAPQEAFLFSDTLAQNVRFGLRDLDAPDGPARVAEAVSVAGLERDLLVLPDGLETVVGERGISLSGGQRQRVALARALSADPRLLILDNSLSAVDAETERAILDRLRGVLARRTSVVISHRVAAVKHADQIVVLDQGKIAERGTHAELVARGGIYADLYQRELLSEALEKTA